MSRAVEDTALLQTPIPLGKDGVHEKFIGQRV
ncbi:unnamed protein product [Enterobius vermicularis]|uniref:Transposase n=1 Tax=Enterobius vermicularis TaxID=51028 RepID=A0A0N4UUA8_ENTVE|nr:unnamed protein product [Enterobius vermicularis]